MVNARIPFTSLPGPWISPVRDICSPVLAKSPSFSTRSPRPLRIPPSPSSKPPSEVFSSCFLVMWLFSFDLNFIFPHFRMKGLVVDLEEACGLGFVSAGSQQGVDNCHPLNVDRVAPHHFPQRVIAADPAGRGGTRHQFACRQDSAH